jgi:glutaredoxin 2
MQAHESSKDSLINHLTQELKHKEKELRNLSAAFSSLERKLSKLESIGDTDIQASPTIHNLVTVLDLEFSSKPDPSSVADPKHQRIMGSLLETLDDFKQQFESDSWKLIS